MIKIIAVLTCIFFIGCENRAPAEYFNRMPIKECLTLIQSGETLGLMVCNGVVMDIPSKLVILQDQENVEEVRAYMLEREMGHYLCLLSRRRCKR